MDFKYKTAVLGGTFDHFHIGHEKLMEYSFSISQRLIIGITSESYISNSKFRIQNSEFFENFEVRKKNVEDFLNNIAPNRFEIVEINDIFGPTLDGSFEAEAIIVSRETRKGAEEINRQRVKLGLSQFEIVEVEDVFAQDKILLSSERIRKGEIDRNGEPYVDPGLLSADHIMPDELREEFKKPWGKLLKVPKDTDFRNSSLIAAVGDETSKVLNRLGIKFQIAVIDFKIARQKRFSDIKELGFFGNEIVYKVLNNPGSVSSALFKTVSEVLKRVEEQSQIILIDGEDDLAVVPLILLSSLGTYIYYGQPGEAHLQSPQSEASGGQGIVKIVVDEDIKAKIRELVARFKTLGH